MKYPVPVVQPRKVRPAKMVVTQTKATKRKTQRKRKAVTEASLPRQAIPSPKSRKARSLRDTLGEKSNCAAANGSTSEQVSAIRRRMRERVGSEERVTTGRALPIRISVQVGAKDETGAVAPKRNVTTKAVETADDRREHLKVIQRQARKLRFKRDYVRAEPCFRKALELLEGLLPPGHEGLVRGLDDYADILLRLDRTEQSVVYKNKSNSIREKCAPSEGVTLRTRTVNDKLAPLPPVALRMVESSEQPPASDRSLPPQNSLSRLDSPVSTEQITSLSDLLHIKSPILRLEEFMRWDSLGEGWASRREGWVEEICSASAVNELSQLVAEFESQILWEVSEEGWESARDDWHAGFIEATEMSSLVEALIVLEDHVCFRAFLDGWVGERVHWGRMVQWSDSD